MSTVKIGLTGHNADSLPSYAQGIVVSMTDNDKFATPAPALTVVHAAILALVAANGVVEANPGPAERFARRTAMNDLVGLIRLLASYVQTTSAGDEATILSSGFAVRKRATPRGELPTPTGLYSRPANREGRATLKWDPDAGADSFNVHQCDTEAPGNWQLVASTTKSSCHVDGLVPGKFYWFAVSALGAAGETSLSEPCQVLAAA